MEWSEMPSLCIFLTATFVNVVLDDSLNILSFQRAALTCSALSRGFTGPILSGRIPQMPHSPRRASDQNP